MLLQVVFMMTTNSRGATLFRRRKQGANYFGYYQQKINELFNYPESSGPSKQGCFKQRLSDSHAQRLKTVLEDSIASVNEDVDKHFRIVLSVLRLRNYLKVNQQLSDHVTDVYRLAGTLDSEQLRNDFQLFLEKGGVQAEMALRRYSDDLSLKLSYMEQYLEEYIDTIVSKCRPMTEIEKLQLGHQIKGLCGKSRDRVAGIIIQHTNPSAGPSCEDLHVNLDLMDNLTLWRLYYYVEMLAQRQLDPWRLSAEASSGKL